MTTLPIPNADASTEVVDTLFAVLGIEKGASLVVDQVENTDVRTDQPWVLSIDDDDNLALALEIRLKQVGVQLIRAASGMEGYRTAFVEAPRAILLDYEMPEGNGDYVLRRLKESPATSEIPVICLTGRHEKSIERQMRNLGADEFFTKPFDWNELWKFLNRYID